jgi:YcxB-like protein
MDSRDGAKEDHEPVVIVGQAEVGADDLRQALARLPGRQRLWLWPGLLVVFTVLRGVVDPESFDSSVVLALAVPSVIVVALMSYFVVAGRRAWVKQALANIGGPTSFRFDDFGFSSESKLRQHRLAWTALARATETPESFLIYTSPQTLLIVPKRAFSAADVTALQSLLPERIPPKPDAPARFGNRRPLLMWVVLIVAALSIWHFFSLDGESSPRRGAADPDAPAAVPAEGGVGHADGER